MPPPNDSPTQPAPSPPAGDPSFDAHRTAEYLRLFIEHTPAAVAVFDRQMRYLAASRRWYEDYQLPSVSVLGRTHYEVFPDVPDRWPELHRRCLAGETIRCEEDLFERDDGSQVWIKWELCPWREPTGEVGGIIMFTKVVTERKLAADRLMESQRELRAALDQAEEARRARDVFVANVTHELRTPLSAIIGYAEVAAQADEPWTRRTACSVIRRNADHLLALVNDLLDISKVDADRLDLEHDPADLRALVEQAVQTVSAGAMDKAIALRTEGVAALPTLRTDATRVRQVLLNLLSNAVKFTEAGAVVVSARAFDRADGLVEVEIDVADSGIGMDEEVARRLFALFVQADASTSRRFGGTGLGLALSRRLARLLGGDVECVRTAPGVGTTMRFRFAAPTVARSSPAPEHPLAGRRVLLAEDGLDNRVLLAHQLRSGGAEVCCVETGEQAVHAALDAEAAGAPFDVILMDVRMPELDGDAATRRLREQGYRGPIVALTANATDAERARCLDAGCDDFASKPIGRDRLLALCARWSPRRAA